MRNLSERGHGYLVVLRHWELQVRPAEVFYHPFIRTDHTVRILFTRHCCGRFLYRRLGANRMRGAYKHAPGFYVLPEFPSNQGTVQFIPNLVRNPTCLGIDWYSACVHFPYHTSKVLTIQGTWVGINSWYICADLSSGPILRSPFS